MILLEFASEAAGGPLQLELRFKDMDRFIGGQAYIYYHPVEVKSEGSCHAVEIPIKKIINESGVALKSDQLIWLAIVKDGKDYPILGSAKINHFIESFSKYFTIKSSCNKKNELNFKLGVTKPAFKIDMKPDADGTFFQLASAEHLHQKLYIRKRINKDAGIHSESFQIPHTPGGYRLQSGLLHPGCFEDDTTIFDFCFESELDGGTIESFAKVKNTDSFQTHSFPLENKSYIGELYQTKKGNLALKVTRKYKTIKIKHIEEISPDLYKVSLPVKVEGTPAICRYNKMTYISSQDCYTEYKTLELYPDGENDSYFLLDLKGLFGEIDTNYEQRYRILVKTKDGLFYKIGLENKIEHCHLLEQNEVWIEGEKVFNLFIRNKQNRSVRIGVLGSCYSRSHFNSVTKFYNNKDYKLIFNVGYSHFWPSIISMVSDPIPFDQGILQDLADRKAAEIQSELNKSIIAKLKEAAVDYLMIDFYVDAIHGVRLYENGASIGVNPSVRSTSFYRNDVLKNTRQLDARDPEFFGIWAKACDEFIAKIQEFIPQERIVLNTGGLIDTYYDRKREVKSFIDEKIISRKELTYYNSNWDRMNHYFLTKAPKAKVIDMKKYGYIGDITHPSPFGPHHYESSYYRSLTGELARIVTFDKARETVQK